MSLSHNRTAISQCSLCGLDFGDSRFVISPLPPGVTSPLLHSNAPPTSKAKAVVKDHLLHISESIVMLGEAIERLRQAGAELEHERVKHLGLISPVRSFPPEILSQIFRVIKESWWEDVRQWEFEKNWKEGFSRRRPPKLVPHPVYIASQVCHGWRAAARAYSNLWSNIYIDGDCSIASTEAFVSEQLVLSATQPLHIIMSSKTLNLSHFGPIIQQLQQTHQRWSSLSIHTLGASHPLLLSAAKSPIFPSLVSMTLEIHWSSFSSCQLLAADVPLLTDVSISWIGSQAAMLDLPWAQLRRLQMQCPSEATIAKIVPDIHTVQELHILYAELELEFSYVEETVCLPHLNCLHLSNASEAGVGGILRFLRLPALKTLVWTQMGCGEEIKLVDMLKRSSPQGDRASLAEMRLVNPDVDLFRGYSSPMLMVFQTLLPTLEAFQIECLSSSGTHFGSIAHHLNLALRSGKAPHLRVFKIRGMVILAKTIRLLLSYVLQRSDLEFRVLNCAVHPGHIHNYTYASRILDLLNQSPPGNTQLELNLEGPDHKRIVYIPEHGARIEEGCWCQSDMRAG